MNDQRNAGKDLLKNPVEWGRLLITTLDHDPLYVGLSKWDVKGSRLRRFLLAYWCCYSTGASWYISQQSGSRFWNMLRTAAENVQPSPLGDRWPRAHERRHWRGQKCVDSVDQLKARFKHPEDAIIRLESCRSLGEVNTTIGAWPQFGPWIAFKAADMLERVLAVPVAFPNELITLFKDPKEGAEMMSTLMDPNDDLGIGPQDVVSILLHAYEDMLAPGHRDSGRTCNIQEVETVLCKWKSGVKGHYYIGKDTDDHRRELRQWEAHDLLAAYPIPLA